MSTENISNTETPFYAKKQPAKPADISQQVKDYNAAFFALRKASQDLIRQALESPQAVGAIRYPQMMEAYEVARFINERENYRLDDQHQLISLNASASRFKAGNL